jgi:hypothetical protein
MLRRPILTCTLPVVIWLHLATWEICCRELILAPFVCNLTDINVALKSKLHLEIHVHMLQHEVNTSRIGFTSVTVQVIKEANFKLLMLNNLIRLHL